MASATSVVEAHATVQSGSTASYLFTRNRRRRRSVTDTHDHGSGAATDSGGQGLGLPGAKICLAVKVVHRRLDVKACLHCAFILKQVPAFDRPLKVTIPGEEKKDARGFKVVPTVDEDGMATERTEGDEEGQGEVVGEKQSTYGGDEGDGESDGKVDNLGNGESTVVDGDSTVVTGISMVTDRCQLEGTISGLSSGDATITVYSMRIRHPLVRPHTCPCTPSTYFRMAHPR